MKKRIVQFHVYKGDKQYVAEGVDVAIVTQAATLDELTSNIEEAVGLHFEGQNLSELGFIEEPSVLVNLELANLAHA